MLFPLHFLCSVINCLFEELSLLPWFLQLRFFHYYWFKLLMTYSKTLLFYFFSIDFPLNIFLHWLLKLNSTVLVLWIMWWGWLLFQMFIQGSQSSSMRGRGRIAITRGTRGGPGMTRIFHRRKRGGRKRLFVPVRANRLLQPKSLSSK